MGRSVQALEWTGLSSPPQCHQWRAHGLNTVTSDPEPSTQPGLKSLWDSAFPAHSTYHSLFLARGALSSPAACPFHTHLSSFPWADSVWPSNLWPFPPLSAFARAGFCHLQSGTLERHAQQWRSRDGPAVTRQHDLGLPSECL